MNKCHTTITWANDQTPAINDTHLNQYDGELDTLDDRIITLDTTKAAQSDLLLAFKDVSINSSTGVITFTLFNNTTKTIDTLLEKIAINFDYDDDPTSPHYQNLIIELEDGTYKYIDMSALITEYEFVNSSTVAFTVANDGSVSASVIDGSITSSKLDPAFAVVIADAETNGLRSEGFAVGEQNGVPVTSGSPYFENNAKWYKEQAAAIAQQQLGGLSDVTLTTPSDGQVLTYDSNSGDWINADASKGMLPHVVITTEAGATVTLTKGGTTITATETSTGIFETDVDDYGTWTITVSDGNVTVTDTISVDTVKVYSATVSFFDATITVNYPDNMRGESFTCVNGGTTLTETAPANANTFDFHVRSAGTWTVTGAYAKTAIITSDGDTATLTFCVLKTFATATDQEIADMVSEADLGFIDLADDCGWTVGQEHQVSLSAMTASGAYDGVSWSVGEAHNAQTVTFVLMHKGLYELVNSVLDKQGQTRNVCSFVVGMKDNLSGNENAKTQMNPSSMSTVNYTNCARHNWCNGAFRGAIPSTLRSAFKQFKTVTAETYNSATNEVTNDYFALPAEKEVVGSSASKSNAVEINALTQFTWYETASNRIKNYDSGTGYGHQWFLRSPAISPYQTNFDAVNVSGGIQSNAPNNYLWVSPFGCL